MNYKFYSINNNRLLCKNDENAFEYKDNKWIEIDPSVITDRLMGYDSGEPSGSPYGIGSTDIMDSINELTQAQVIKTYGKEVIDKIK